MCFLDMTFVGGLRTAAAGQSSRDLVDDQLFISGRWVLPISVISFGLCIHRISASLLNKFHEVSFLNEIIDLILEVDASFNIVSILTVEATPPCHILAFCRLEAGARPIDLLYALHDR